MRLACIIGVLLCLSAGAQRPAPRRVFEGVLVPLAELSSQTLVETPHVGWVRLERRGLPPLEGRLVGLGRGAFQLAMGGGVLRIESGEVRALTQFPSPQAPVPALSRLNTPAGILEGQLEERGPDGARVLLPGGSGVQVPGLKGDT